MNADLIMLTEDCGETCYNAFQLSVARRFNTGLTLNSQYTLSRSFGNTAGSNEALTAGNIARTASEAPAGSRTPSFDYDRGYNAFDIRHTFNLSALYSLPFGKGRAHLNDLSGVAEALLGGWRWVRAADT